MGTQSVLLPRDKNNSNRQILQPEESPNTTNPEAYQRVGGLVVIPGLLREMGFDPIAILARAGIARNVLDHVENRIPYTSLSRLFRECAVTTGCSYFGFLAHQRVGLSHLGIPGELIRYSENLRAGLQTFILYQHLYDQRMAIFLLEEHGIAAFGCAAFDTHVELVDQIYDAFLAVACNIMRELWGGWAPEKVDLSRTRPLDVGAYRRFFFAPIHFDAERTAVFFPSALLNRPMREANPERFRMMKQRAQALGNPELLTRLRRALRVLLLKGRASAEEVSSFLFLHPRTLSRRLHDCGTTFQEVLDEVRFEAARQLLEMTQLPLTDIAASLGYSESSAFTRAFRRWCSMAPSRMRQEEQCRRYQLTTSAPSDERA